MHLRPLGHDSLSRPGGLVNRDRTVVGCGIEAVASYCGEDVPATVQRRCASRFPSEISQNDSKMAEAEGFEPPDLAVSGFQDRRLKPLGHTSGASGSMRSWGRRQTRDRRNRPPLTPEPEFFRGRPCTDGAPAESPPSHPPAGSSRGSRPACARRPARSR